ncbi:putative arterivirus GP3 envelope glycoprotein [Medicago truncatula]|uniref:Putative arterivirus GP3 envelope glycoprotein n=1 Tax=Medicago truncatula TaxID=3880 RepID=A0A396JKS7_MEDTR|nr:putative arterivirus GP3 envelope glycoprotein [Medicago truncatula]
MVMVLVHQETVTKPILADTLQASRVISEPGVWALVGHGDERRNDGDTFKINIHLNLMSESTILCIDFFWRSYVGNFYNERFGSGRFLLHQEMAGSKGRKFCLSGMNSLRIVLPMSSLSCISFWWGCMSGNVSCDPT